MPVGADKKPLLASWKQYQTKAATPEQIEEWWEKWPDANIGIITGAVSGISVIDVDTYHGGDHAQFPATYTVRTGNGGYHLYYKHHPGLSISANAYAQFPGIDIRSDGGFVVGPYSVTEYKGKDGEAKGGTYETVDPQDPAVFPASMFPAKKPRKKLTAVVGVSSGSRNDSIASFCGTLLHSAPENEWETEVWTAVQRVNKTYSPPLKHDELRTTFESIAVKEKSRRAALIVSPMQLDDGQKIEISIRKNKAGTAYKDMANVLAILSQHPYYKGAIRYNEFKQEIEYDGRPFEEADLIKIQYFMQTDAELHGVTKEAVHSAIQHYANQNSYDEAKEWLTSLEWDGVERLKSWVHSATGVEDNDYYSGIGSHWLMGMVRRIMIPGSTFDYVLLLVGPQGIGKTSFFRIIGGPWYKSYTGAMDNKDFYLALRGAMLIDLDEGAALYRSEAIKIKSIITETHDEYRAPYDRVMKKYARRFVFSMSTNDTEPFRDATGNRRYWAIDAKEKIDFKWLETNREQLFAETYHYFNKGIAIPEVPFDKAAESQEMHLPEDSWTDLVMQTLQKHQEYNIGSIDFFTTVPELYMKMFPNDDLSRLGKSQEMRIAQILKKAVGLEKRRVMVDGDRKTRWMLTPERSKQLQQNNAPSTRDPLEDAFSPEDHG